jgi:NAD kinase
MQRLTENKIVLVVRKTRLAELVARFNTVQQARFYVEHLGADFSDYLREDETYRRSVSEAQRILETLGRLQTIERGFLPNFLFGKGDTVVVLGQDGLVANTVKYLDGQPVIGVNPDPRRWDGQLLPFSVHDLPSIVLEVFSEKRPIKRVTMAKAELNNGLHLYAVNDLFIGPKTHTSIRYSIRLDDREEQHSSSGVVVSTGMGSTGWLKSLITGATSITRRIIDLQLPPNSTLVASARSSRTADETIAQPVDTRTPSMPWDADYLCFTVREPFPTRTTQTSLVFGRITDQRRLTVTSLTAENGVIFSDGVEADFLEFNSGTQATIGLAERSGCLVA